MNLNIQTKKAMHPLLLLLSILRMKPSFKVLAYVTMYTGSNLGGTNFFNSSINDIF